MKKNSVINYTKLATTKDKIKYIEDNCEINDSNDILYLLLSFEYIKMRKKIDYSLLGRHDLDICINNIMKSVKDAEMHDENEGFILTTKALLHDALFDNFFAINSELQEIKDDDIKSITHFKVLPILNKFLANKKDCNDFFKCELHSSVMSFIEYMYMNHSVNYILIR